MRSDCSVQTALGEIMMQKKIHYRRHGSTVEAKRSRKSMNWPMERYESMRRPVRRSVWSFCEKHVKDGEERKISM